DALRAVRRAGDLLAHGAGLPHLAGADLVRALDRAALPLARLGVGLAGAGVIAALVAAPLPHGLALARDAVGLLAALLDLAGHRLAGGDGDLDGLVAVLVAGLDAVAVHRAADVLVARLVAGLADGAADFLDGRLADRLADRVAALPAVLLAPA